MDLERALKELRRRRPLVHNITNFVVMNTTANVLLAIGASPVMAHAIEELEEMINIADSVVINIGTLDESWVESMIHAVKIANEYEKPVILDPVGAGATRYRTSTALKLIEIGDIYILRGNYSEIKSLIGEKGRTRGVDSISSGEDAKDVAVKASEMFNTTAVVTGKVDYVSNGKKCYAIENGTPMLAWVTGTGCMLTSIMGAFSAVASPLDAAIASLLTFEIAAEKAEEEAPYPGSFHMKLYDWLYRIDEELIRKRKKVREIEP